MNARPGCQSAPLARTHEHRHRCARRTSVRQVRRRLWTRRFPGFPGRSAHHWPDAASRCSANLCIPRQARFGKNLPRPFQRPGYLYLPRSYSLLINAKAAIIRRTRQDAMKHFTLRHAIPVVAAKGCERSRRIQDNGLLRNPSQPSAATTGVSLRSGVPSFPGLRPAAVDYPLP